MAQAVKAGRWEGDKHPFVTFALLARDWWPNLVAAVGGLLLIIPGFTNDQGEVTALPWHPSRWVVFLAAGAVWAFGQAAVALRQRRITVLEGENEEMTRQSRVRAAAIAGLARVELALLATELGYSSSERITLLAIDGDEAALVARFSPCLPFEKRGRGRYPVDSGVVGEAYQVGVGEILDLPDPRTDARGWRGELRSRCGIAGAIATALTMPSRSIVAIRIDQSGPGGRYLGFLVFESTRAAAEAPATCILAAGELQERLADQHAARFQGLLDVVCRLGVAA